MTRPIHCPFCLWFCFVVVVFVDVVVVVVVVVILLFFWGVPKVGENDNGANFHLKPNNKPYIGSIYAKNQLNWAKKSNFATNGLS